MPAPLIGFNINSSAKPEELMRKREEFSVSLRNKKKTQILAEKRQRNIQSLTKAKFLYMQKENRLEVKQDPKLLSDLIEQINKSLKYPFGHLSAFKVDDIIQILKEMHQISRNDPTNSAQFKTLIQHQGTKSMLLVLLTMDYGQTVEQEQLIDLMIWTCCLFTNVILDNAISEEIIREYNILNILNTLLKKYFLTDFLGI